jgi:ankyrin repeat protein
MREITSSRPWRIYSDEYHADLLRTILKAGDMPWLEDFRGRNGLHCLAEVDFELPIPTNSSSQGNSLEEKEEGTRQRYLDSLLDAGVNPNNYDTEGNTPLMAFITHHRAGENDDTATQLLSKLLSSGADIHRRNRRGETALHLAVKLGRRAATKFLLSHGANVHVRNKKGLGIVRLGWAASEKSSHDETLYAQIMLCISLTASAGAKPSPTILQEWTLK